MRSIFIIFLRGCLIVIAATSLLNAGAFAEKADRTKDMELTAKSGTFDKAKNVNMLEGDVVLEQGTMKITAERMVTKEDIAGYVTAQAVGTAAKQITFRQKRDGLDDFVDGVADRAEYDDKASTLKLFGRARLTSGGDVAQGEYIYFNTATEVYAIRNSAADDKPGVVPPDASGRVKITIKPRVREATETKDAKSGAEAAKAADAPK